MRVIDLARTIPTGDTRVAGFLRGRDLRQHFGLDALDGMDGHVLVDVPVELAVVDPDFLRGLFGPSAATLGPRFSDHYVLDATPRVRRQFEAALADPGFARAA